jgi:hypothetical protein
MKLVFHAFFRPCRDLMVFLDSDPAINCWAISFRPAGLAKAINWKLRLAAFYCSGRTPKTPL